MRLKMATFQVSLTTALSQPTDDGEAKVVYNRDGLWQSLNKDEKIRISSENYLQRFQFFELLVRLAGQKYKISHSNEMGIYYTYHESLQRLLDEILKNIPQSDFSPEFFRCSQLWSNDISTYFQANMDVVTRLFQIIHHGKKYVSIEDVQYLM